MKFNNFRRSSASMLTFAMMLMLVSPSLIWANSAGKITLQAPLDTVAGSRAIAMSGILKRDDRKDFSREELEQMRSALLDLVEANREVAALFPAMIAGKTAGKGNDYDASRERIQKMADSDLASLRSVMDPLSMQKKLARSRAVVANIRNTSNTAGLPGVNSYCGAPVDTAGIIAADVIYFVAEGVRDVAQNICNQVVAGFNTRAACEITDAVYLVAKGVNVGIHFCDDDYAASIGEANYARLDHIHSDLEASIVNDDANKTMIVSNDNTNKDTIVSNDNTNTTTIVSNDNTNTATITALITAALNAIITNANANKDELKFLVLRTQIEADLAAPDSATPVALYQTLSTTCTTPSVPNPLTQCGYLDLVSAIVQETITNLGGPNMAAAQALLVQANAQKAAGNFKAAYTTYRKAYKTSAK